VIKKTNVFLHNKYIEEKFPLFHDIVSLLLVITIVCIIVLLVCKIINYTDLLFSSLSNILNKYIDFIKRGAENNNPKDGGNNSSGNDSPGGPPGDDPSGGGPPGGDPSGGGPPGGDPSGSNIPQNESNPEKKKARIK
jgi:hypothetical protein